MKLIQIFLISFSFLACKGKSNNNPVVHKKNQILEFDSSVKVAHIMVALCDNEFQGIVPVPAKIGNGKDKNNNLYWGCSFGIKTFFKNSKTWSLVKSYKVDSIILERIILKHTSQNWYLVADAYDGELIKQCTVDFLSSSCGSLKDTVKVNGKILGINGNAQIVSYIGHNGLMDFSVNESFSNTDKQKREIIILACKSKQYFKDYIKAANANPLVWTTGLMCPEAYTVHDAINAYIDGKSKDFIQMSAAKAYSKYQKCSFKAANNLLVNSW